MFSPAIKKTSFSSRKDRTLGHASDFPVTPVAENRRLLQDGSVPNRPSTGTPAPWASRLSVLARIPQVKKNENREGSDEIRPVFVGEFPQIVRDEQALLQQKHAPGESCMVGGMEKGTNLAWIICGGSLFLWNYMSPAASVRCVVLNLPSSFVDDSSMDRNASNNWILSVVNWDNTHPNQEDTAQQNPSAGVVMCNKRTQAIIYWPEIYSEEANSLVTSCASVDELEIASSSCLNSLIACAVPRMRQSCIVLACGSNGELWQFCCSPSRIERRKIYHNILSSQGSDSTQHQRSKGYPRSLLWRFPYVSEETVKQFFVLTDQEIQCFAVKFLEEITILKLWSHVFVGADSDSGIQKNLAGQKRIWPLDMQVDKHGKVITILIATFCMDRLSSSSYIEYSLLTMQYRSGLNSSPLNIEPIHERVLEKKAPIQVVIPKARVEDEDFLFSMKLRVGGKPSGSVIILSGDGTATVSHYWGNSTRLYQFDLPYDAGKVMDASVLPSFEDSEGAWAILTEKAGVWAIPEKAVLLGGVEPPERSLSRKGSSNESSAQEERRNLSLASNIAPRRVNSDVWEAGDKQRGSFATVARRTAQDEESEALLNHLFHNFLLSGQVDGSLEKLRNAGAFERDGETNVFARVSKSIVDTLAKHWTTTRGAEIVALAVVSSQLMEKQQKHQKLLQFLALSKCHEELCSKQNQSLYTIMEHGEKLSAMVQLRALQNSISSVAVHRNSSTEKEFSGCLWDLIQFVGERARRNTVLLMDRDNAEVFYSKVSDLEELFYCLDKQLEYLISTDIPLLLQVQRACEISKACVTLVNNAMQYKNEHHMWYPPVEGLTSWYGRPVVRNGLWRIASFMLHLLNQTSHLDTSTKLEFYSNLKTLAEVSLEAYSGAITAKLERGEEHRGILDEYWKRRDTLLESLYQLVKSYNGTISQEPSEATENQDVTVFRKLSSDLLSIAKRHEGYKTLWNMCCDLDDTELLRNLMHESMGPKGGFSYFVFKQLYEGKLYSKLLRLGEEFQEELTIFLKQHKDLLWLHQVFLHQVSPASETLHELALSQDDTSADDDMADSSTYTGLALNERKRLLNLSKIAAVAGQNAESDAKLKRIEADLKIMKLQEDILNLLPENDEERQKIGNNLLSPLDLIELCIKSSNQIRELSILAFDVFAWTSSSFLSHNRTLLVECWRNAIEQDDWLKLYQASVLEGWSDEHTLQVLRETVLFLASSRFYGPEAKTFEGGFYETLPLRRTASMQENNNNTVEDILMTHKDFPEAGKLMVMAVMLGTKSDDDRVGEEEFTSPME
ncbi:nuclear pore complex protein NUP133 isoform X2 [Impatiens glandulifera]|uniref:nuclear pore complex protein NUP133 isoform X2 n=1 Tax=Impatiens glandulifera TaxID=253017 RepID=UPI001FB13363|nr:nuclear pore complex protein NUP133 isoform X2 [Impatiens glandulifera]